MSPNKSGVGPTCGASESTDIDLYLHGLKALARIVAKFHIQRAKLKDNNGKKVNKGRTEGGSKQGNY